MASLSKSLAHDAGKRPKPETPRTVIFNGERRSEKWVSGYAERFVDLQGNVTEIQMVPPGTPRTGDAVERKRQQMHLLRSGDGTTHGFIEHHRCPVGHGLLRQMPALSAEFDEIFTANPDLPRGGCTADPKTVTTDARGIRTYHSGCVHIEALIAHRRSVETARREARSGRQESILDIEKKKLLAAEQQAQDTRKLLEKVVDKLDSKQAKNSKAIE